MTDYTNYKDPTGFIICLYCKQRTPFSDAFLCCQIGYATCRDDANRPCPKCHKQRNKKFIRVEKSQNQKIDNERIVSEDKKNNQRRINNNKILYQCIQCQRSIRKEEDIGNIITKEKDDLKNTEKLVVCKQCCHYAKHFQNKIKKQSVFNKDRDNYNQDKNQQRNLKDKDYNIQKNKQNYHNQKIQGNEVLRCISCNERILGKNNSFSIQGLQDSKEIRICYKCKQESLKQQIKNQKLQQKSNPNFLKKLQTNNDFKQKDKKNIQESTLKKLAQSLQNKKQNSSAEIQNNVNEQQRKSLVKEKTVPKVIFLKVEKIKEQHQVVKPINSQNKIKKQEIEQKQRQKEKQKNVSCIQSKYKYKPAKQQDLKLTPTGQQLSCTQIPDVIQDDQQQLKKNPKVKAKIIQEQNVIVEDQFIEISFQQENQCDMVSCVDCCILIQKTNALSPSKFKQEQFQKQNSKKNKDQDRIYMCKTCYVHQHLISRKNIKKQQNEYKFEYYQKQKDYNNKNGNAYMNNYLIPEKQQKQNDLHKSQSPNKYYYRDNYKQPDKKQNNYLPDKDNNKKSDILIPTIERRTYSDNNKIPNKDTKIDLEEAKKSPIYQYAVQYARRQKQIKKDKKDMPKCKKCNKSQQKIGLNGFCASCFTNIMAPSLLPSKSSS